tara:strand:+ start:539 stop:787 length:249 start_codon:yes stop_codon:yes gene_type:complete
MIDLERCLQLAAVAFIAGTLVLISHLLTMQMMWERFEGMSRDIHQEAKVEQVENIFPLPRLNNLDSLAYCISMVSQMEKDNQ